MPSQVFDDGYGVYEVPSGDRLVFKGGEGADASYNIPSTFAKAASPARVSRSSAMGSADRFTSPGSYLRKPATAAVGPGSYTASPPSRPSSRYGPWGPEVNQGNGRLQFDGVGEGADATYNASSAFQGKRGSPSRNIAGFGSSERFGKVGSYLRNTDAPGPGAYVAKSPKEIGETNGVMKRDASPPVRDCERLQFNPTYGMGESPGPAYKVNSSFDKSIVPSAVSSFGVSDRFHSPGSYLSKGDTPGPAAYTVQGNQRPASAGPRSMKTRAVDFGPTGEGAAAAYRSPSAFDKAAARGNKPSSSFGSASRFDKHGSYRAKSAAASPGPGDYNATATVKGDAELSTRKSFAAGNNAPPTKDKGRVDFGPAGEGVAAAYNIRSSFDSQNRKRGPSASMGSGARFDGVGSYCAPTPSPGPGAYSGREEVVRTSAPQASFASPKMRPPGWGNRPRSALNSSRRSY